MQVIWKRPDGFHTADPSDYKVVEIATNARIWLHKSDHENYPFRVSSDWKGEEQTKKLNNLTNLILHEYKSWFGWVKSHYHHSNHDSAEDFLKETRGWLDEIKKHSKGDHWEIEIIHQSVEAIKQYFQFPNDHPYCAF